MRIAYDARPLIPPQTGIGRYLQGVLEGLLRYRDIENFFLCSCKGIQVEEKIYADLRVKQLVAQGWKGTFWLQCILPFYLRRCQADLLHGSLYLSPFFCPCPSIAYVYDLSFRYFPHYLERKNRLILNAFVPFSIRHAKRIVTLSDYTKREIIKEWQVPQEKVVVIPGAPSSLFGHHASPQIESAVRAGYGLDTPYILYVGTLEPRKNVIRLVEAFHSIYKMGMTEYSLVLVGRPGWGLRALYTAVEQSTLKERIKLLHFVQDQDLSAIYRGADVFVYLSLYEGYGFPPLEAMACGIPVVVSNRASIPECVGDGGIFVDPCDIEDITGKVLPLLKDKELRHEVSMRGFFQSQKFSWEKSGAMTLALYRQMCGLSPAV